MIDERSVECKERISCRWLVVGNDISPGQRKDEKHITSIRYPKHWSWRLERKIQGRQKWVDSFTRVTSTGRKFVASLRALSGPYIHLVQSGSTIPQFFVYRKCTEARVIFPLRDTFMSVERR